MTPDLFDEAKAERNLSGGRDGVTFDPRIDTKPLKNDPSARPRVCEHAWMGTALQRKVTE